MTRLLIVPLLLIPASCADRRATRPAEGLSIAERVARLRSAFARGGIEAYLRAKRSMLEQGGRLASDEDFHTAGLVFAIHDDDALMSKERELATRLRALADAIERAPGESGREWRAFSNALVSYSFGNSPLESGSVAVELVSLYADIAGTADTWRKELAAQSQAR